jgi:hypothetical protein
MFATGEIGPAAKPRFFRVSLEAPEMGPDKSYDLICTDGTTRTSSRAEDSWPTLSTKEVERGSKAKNQSKLL